MIAVFLATAVYSLFHFRNRIVTQEPHPIIGGFLFTAVNVPLILICWHGNIKPPEEANGNESENTLRNTGICSARRCQPHGTGFGLSGLNVVPRSKTARGFAAGSNRPLNYAELARAGLLYSGCYTGKKFASSTPTRGTSSIPEQVEGTTQHGGAIIPRNNRGRSVAGHPSN